MAGAIKLSMGHLAAMQKKLQSVNSRADGIKKKADKAIGNVVDTGVTAATAYAAGVLQGRTGGVLLPGGVSLELAGGIAMNAMGFFGIGGRHLHSAGNGLLAAHFATVGRGQGKKMLEKVNEERALKGLPETGHGMKLLTGEKKDEVEDTSASKKKVASR